MSLVTQISSAIQRIAQEVQVAKIEPVYWSKFGNVAIETLPFGFRVPPGNWSFVSIDIYASTAPTGAAIIGDILKNATTIWSTTGNRPSIAAAAKGGSQAGNPNTMTWSGGDVLEFRLTQIGTTITGANLSVVLRHRKI